MLSIEDINHVLSVINIIYNEDRKLYTCEFWLTDDFKVCSSGRSLKEFVQCLEDDIESYFEE